MCGKEGGKMKVLVLSPKARYETYGAGTALPAGVELVFCDRSGTEEEWLAAGADAEVLFVTPITWIKEAFIARMPRLKMIHCEGVGVDRIDLAAARRRGIYVCNNAGCNAPAVAELSIMLMTMLLRRILWGDRMVRSGRQNEAVRAMEADTPGDLSSSVVGLVGFGAIAQATAERLRPYGCKVYYYSRHRKNPETERHFAVEYLPLETLAERCDVISLHLPATAESRHLLGPEFFSRVKPGAYLVNTARGAVIDDEALCGAIRSGRLAGAALDAYDPEPVAGDHPLVLLAREFPDRLVLSPHQGGVARSAFRRAHEMLFEDLEKLLAGQRPGHIVNGL